MARLPKINTTNGATDRVLWLILQARKYCKPLTRTLTANKKGLIKVAVVVGFGALLAYGLQKQLLWVLFRPAGNQPFMSGVGTTDYLPNAYLKTGLIYGAPVLFGLALSIIAPNKRNAVRRYKGRLKALAGLLALLGLAYGYFIGLPSELISLLPGFTADQLQPDVALRAYVSFAAAYLLSATYMLQVPLLLIIVNRTRALKTKDLLWSLAIMIPVVLLGTIGMNSHFRLDELRAVAMPVIVTYVAGMGMVWFVNRQPKRQAVKVLGLLEQDMAAQAERLRQLEAAMLLPMNRPRRWVLMPVPADSTPSALPDNAPIEEPITEPVAKAVVEPAERTVVEPVGAPPNLPTAAETALPKRDGRTDYRAAVVRPRQSRRIIM